MNSTEIEKKIEASGLTDRELYLMFVGVLKALELNTPGIIDTLIVTALEVRHDTSKKNL